MLVPLVASDCSASPSPLLSARFASSCPRAVPTSACAAIASASSAKAAKFHTELTTWCAASGTSPSAVADHTVARIATRSDRVRTSSGVPAPRDARRPRRPGSSPAPALRAARITGAMSAAAMTLWEIAVPSPDPAIPIPTPYRSTALSPALRIAPALATMKGVRVSSSPRSVPVAA